MGAMNGTPATSSASGWTRLVVGCAVGCAIVAVIAVVAAGAGLWWFVAPAEQQRTAAVVSPASAGSFHVGDLGADPGVTALFDRVLFEAQRQQQTGMPPWMAELQRAGAAGSSPSTGFRMLLPREATISLETTAAAAEPAIVLALNPRGLTRLIGMMLAGSVASTHAGHQLARLDDDGWAALVGGTFLFATEEEALRTAVDRVLAHGAVTAAPPVDLATPARTWDLTGVVDNADGEVERLLWDPGAAPAGIRRASFGLDLETADRLSGRLVADCGSPAEAAAVLRALHARLIDHARDIHADGLELLAGVRTDGSRAVVDWEVHGLAAAATAWIRDSGGPLEPAFDPVPEEAFDAEPVGAAFE